MPAKQTKPKIVPKRGKPVVTPGTPDDLSVDQAQQEATTDASDRKFKSKDIQGLKYLDMIAPLLERLHDDQCERDKAGNRDLHYDQLCMLVLLYLFKPAITALRSIPQATELAKVKKRLGCGRTSLGSLSEASRVFDADRLKEVIAELGQHAQSVHGQKSLHGINQTITLVDGSLVSCLPRLIDASIFKGQSNSHLVKWRLHTHFEVDRYVPTRIDVTPDAGGQHDERSVLEQTIQRDRLYVMDRGYAKFSLFNKIVQAKSSYVCRVRDNSVYDVLEQRVLSENAVAAGVLSDEIVDLGRHQGGNRERPGHPVRLICVRCSAHTSRGKYHGTSTGPSSDGILRIVTNMLDVPAEIIALIYSQRWIIEIFFRFFKQLMGCSQLIFHSQNGIEIQCYCALIACLLINIWTGRKPTKRTFEMISYYFMGLASEEELIAHLEKLKRHYDATATNQ
ncbi:Transposase DDE domain protein [Stieleria maiorica]|uniref:Transposase DDE domain protein n=1 Tax=Stieleria maiorica TaxID=2795974 RepID=A0A5B9MLU0_9BACT|nr:Transposase DDE domain protein [Stieleria maiorica]